MNMEAEISELVLKCEAKGIQLPENSWQALREVILALKSTQQDDTGYVQIPEALEQLKRKFSGRAGAKEAAPMAPSPRVVRRQKRTIVQDSPKSKRRNVTVKSSNSDAGSRGQTGLSNTMSPLMSSKKKKKNTRKSRIQEEVEATPASRDENQTLVDQLVQLGEYEMHHGHSQRGTSRMRAAKAICNADVVIMSGAQAKQLDNVGPAVAAKIDQLLNDGLAAALSEYEEALSGSK
ncbi:unnamed protein product [Peronospora belbahrii]|uniref:Crossover junction endonuclease MUS81-like HHH domain-containing protein n=1 Tax=Peronospora belbahrii TaxID=622444 RepID=A0ABN8D3R1_9STRA|nr:unnamed protein product [Peronospora belbahrii]